MNGKNEGSPSKQNRTGVIRKWNYGRGQWNFSSILRVFILSRASEAGSPTNPPWAPGSDKTRGQGSFGAFTGGLDLLGEPDYFSHDSLYKILKRNKPHIWLTFLLRQGEPGTSQYKCVGTLKETDTCLIPKRKPEVYGGALNETNTGLISERKPEVCVISYSYLRVMHIIQLVMFFHDCRDAEDEWVCIESGRIHGSISNPHTVLQETDTWTVWDTDG